MKKELSGVVTKVGANPGPTVAIFGGTHGDEQAGIMTVTHLINNLNVTAGTVHLVYANEQAIAANKRYLHKNLNRLFTKGSDAPTCYEETRAQELLQLLDSCDALLDLHSYNEPFGESTPFTICEADCYDIVKTIDVPVVISNIDTIEKGGTDGYMYNAGKPGICVELGAIEEPEKFLPLGIDTAYQFLQHFGCVAQTVTPHATKQTFMYANGIYKKRTEGFTFSKPYKTFDTLLQGDVIAQEDSRPVLSQVDGYILFPREEHPIGVEVFLTASKVSE